MKRFLTAFVATAMVVSSLPATAFAEEENVNGQGSVLEEVESEGNKVAEIQALIDVLPEFDEFVEMNSEEQEEVVAQAYAIYEKACELEDEDFEALELDKVQDILSYEPSGEIETLALGENQVAVSTESELISAIAMANGTADNPTKIIALKDIELTSTLVIPDEKHVCIVGSKKDITIYPNASFAGSILISVGSTEYNEGSLSLDTITLDGKEKTECVFVRREKDVLIDNAVIKNGYSVGSGGGVMVTWSPGGAEPTISISNTEIFNCKAGGKYGGALCSYACGQFTLENIYFHDNLANWIGPSGYTSKLSLRGKIITTGEFYECPITVVGDLDTDSIIKVKALTTDKIIINGTDNKKLTQDDLKKFELVGPSDATLYLDENANAIKAACKGYFDWNRQLCKCYF